MNKGKKQEKEIIDNLEVENSLICNLESGSCIFLVFLLNIFSQKDVLVT